MAQISKREDAERNLERPGHVVADYANERGGTQASDDEGIGSVADLVRDRASSAIHPNSHESGYKLSCPCTPSFSESDGGRRVSQSGSARLRRVDFSFRFELSPSLDRVANEEAAFR